MYVCFFRTFVLYFVWIDIIFNGSLIPVFDQYALMKGVQ